MQFKRLIYILAGGLISLITAGCNIENTKDGAENINASSQMTTFSTLIADTDQGATDNKNENNQEATTEASEAATAQKHDGEGETATNNTENSDKNYLELIKPEEWVMDEDASYTSDENITYHFYYHPTDSHESASERLTVIINDQTKHGKDFATYEDTLMIQLETTGCKVSLSEHFTINGYDAWRLAHTGTMSETGDIYNNYMVSVNEENIIHAYVYTYFGSPDEKEVKEKTDFIDNLAKSIK